MIALNITLSANEPHENGQLYELTAIMHPLNAIFYSPNADISTEDSAVVEKVIDPTHLKTDYNPHHISQFHKSLHKLPVSPAEWIDFKMTYLKLIRKNFWIFLKERFSLFRSTLYTAGESYIFSDDAESPPDFFLKELPSSSLPTTHPLFREMRYTLTQTLHRILALLGYLPFLGYLLLNPLFYFCIAYFVSRKSRETALLFKISAVLLLARSFVIFFVVPEPHLTYYSPLIYLPILCIIYSILTPKNQKLSL